MAFIANQGIAPKGDRYDRSALVNDIEGKLYKRTEKGDFIYSSNNLETGSIGLNKYGNACISPVYCIFQPSGIADSDFLGRRLVRKDFIQEMVEWRQGVIYGQWRIHEADFLRLNIAVPSVDEQRLIGKLLDSLDALITLHQRKCQYRGLYGCLSWEQRKLGELFFESNERSSSMEILSVSVAKGIYPASESDRDTNPGASLANYKVVHKGDVVYNSMRMWQGAVGSSDYDGIVSPAYVVARSVIELDSTCFGYLLKRPEMLYKYLCDSQGNSKDTQTLKYNRFADIEVTMPVNLEEQRVISACLGRVDTLITLHQ